MYLNLTLKWYKLTLKFIELFYKFLKLLEKLLLSVPNLNNLEKNKFLLKNKTLRKKTKFPTVSGPTKLLSNPWLPALTKVFFRSCIQFSLRCSHHDQVLRIKIVRKHKFSSHLSFPSFLIQRVLIKIWDGTSMSHRRNEFNLWWCLDFLQNLKQLVALVARHASK